MRQRPRAMPVTRSVAAALALALVASVLVLGAGLVTGRAAADGHHQYGSTFAKSGVLRRGCRTYRFSYSITPPAAGYWALEVFIVGPRGKALASDGYLEGFDPVNGSDTYRLCRATTRPGIFKIKAKLSTVDGNETWEVWLPVHRYRLRAAS